MYIKTKIVKFYWGFGAISKCGAQSIHPKGRKKKGGGGGGGGGGGVEKK